MIPSRPHHHTIASAPAEAQRTHPLFVAHQRPDENLMTTIAMHRRATGWKGPVFVKLRRMH
jgi:hypothetical protein